MFQALTAAVKERGTAAAEAVAVRTAVDVSADRTVQARYDTEGTLACVVSLRPGAEDAEYGAEDAQAD